MTWSFERLGGSATGITENQCCLAAMKIPGRSNQASTRLLGALQLEMAQSDLCHVTVLSSSAAIVD